MKTRKYKTKHRKTRGGGGMENQKEKQQVNTKPVNEKGWLNGFFTSKEDINVLLNKIDKLLKEKNSSITDSMTVGQIRSTLK
jgi:hypothetical protein